jgi:hypothetical protein
MKGMTDIKPMWRIQMLTEQFGPAGIGWYTEITRMETRDGANGDMLCFMDLNLFVRDPVSGEWSKPIFGTGGSQLIAQEKNGLRADDDAWKKTYTDALGVACRSLGIGADVYWAGGALPPAASKPKAIETEVPTVMPEILKQSPKAVSQEDVTAVVRYYYAPISKTAEGKAFVAKVEQAIGNKNYLSIPDAGKRLALFNLVKELVKVD